MKVPSVEVAQLAERPFMEPTVEGSNPVWGFFCLAQKFYPLFCICLRNDGGIEGGLMRLIDSHLPPRVLVSFFPRGFGASVSFLSLLMLQMLP